MDETLFIHIFDIIVALLLLLMIRRLLVGTFARK